MEEAIDRTAISMASAVLPYTLFQNQVVKDLLQCLGDLRQMTNRKTLQVCIEKMGSNYKMTNRVELLDDRYKMVKIHVIRITLLKNF